MNAFQETIKERLAEVPYAIRKIGGDKAQYLGRNTERFLQLSGNSQKQVLVVSAIRSSSSVDTQFSELEGNPGFNTTDHLIAIAEAIDRGDLDRADELFEAIQAFTSSIIEREVGGDYLAALQSCLEREVGKFKAFLEKIRGSNGDEGEEILRKIGEDWIYHDDELGYMSITGFGEHLSQCLYQEYLSRKGLSVSSIDSSSLSTSIFGEHPEEKARKRETLDELRSMMRDQIESIFEGSDLLLSPGYLPVVASKRGYSDKTAALLALGLRDLGKDCVLVVEKNHPILSADPALVDPEVLQLVSGMSYRLATEVFGSKGANAAAIHPSVIPMLKEAGIEVVITNPDNSEGGYTLISDGFEVKKSRVEIIAKRVIPSALIISSPHMVEAFSVLAKITAAFSDVIIDQVITSEETISITFNEAIDEGRVDALREMLSEEFGAEYNVEHRKDLSLVFCLGNNIDAMQETGNAILGMNAAHLESSMGSYNKAASVISFIVPSSQVEETVKVLHKTLIPQRRTVEEANFLDRETALALREKFGSPIFVYSEKLLKEAAQRVLAFKAPYGLTARYAMKANPNASILRLLNDMGIHIDASSGYEAERAIAAGIPAENIMLTAQEYPENLEELVNSGVQFNACSLSQLRKYGELFPNSSVSVRINPGIGSGFDYKTEVAGSGASFGIWHEDIPEIQRIAREYGLTINKVHTHIGSGTDPDVWEEVAEISINLLKHFPNARTLNLGGGFKVGRMSYEKETDLAGISNRISAKLRAFELGTGRTIHLEIEPGTYLTANTGTIVTSIQDITTTGSEGHKFLKLDAGMSEILRTAMYGAMHPLVVIPAKKPDPDSEVEFELVMVVGHCCETADTLTPQLRNPEETMERLVSHAEIGDVLLIEAAGAYCSAMSARNYNSFPAVAEVMLMEDGGFQLIQRRQTMEEMLVLEQLT